MYKLDFAQNLVNSNKQLTNKSKFKQSKQLNTEDQKDRDSKENDSKHLNAIKPYVTKQRKNSKRQIKPVCIGDISRSKSKKFETSNRKIQQSNSMIYTQNIINSGPSQKQANKQINQIFQQLITLKTQYKTLKSSYNGLIMQKQYITTRQEQQRQKFQQYKHALEQDLEKSKKSNNFLQVEIDRIKRQCFKIVESQKFKNKKLQQTIQQKELMITFLRNENQLLKKGKEFNAENDNLQKIFFLRNSAPMFSYESYARLSANTSTISAINNVHIEDQQTPNHLREKQPLAIHHRSQFQDDSLSFSRDRSKEFESVHSLLSNNNQQHILTFTKKDIVVLDDSPKNHSLSSNDECPTFQNRNQQKKTPFNFQNIKSKKGLYKSQSQMGKKKQKSSHLNTKRLQILTHQFKNSQLQKDDQQNSCQTKKKFSKSKFKSANVKKLSKNQGIHNSIINQNSNVINFKKQVSKNSNSKRK